MKNFQAIDQALNNIRDINYWEDVESDNMRSIVEKFNAGDWAALDLALSQKSEEWKARCAQILDESQSQDSFNILLKILCSPDANTVVRALYSIDSLENAQHEKLKSSDDAFSKAKSTLENSNYSTTAKRDYLKLLNSIFSK